MHTLAPSYRGHRFPPEIISHAIWLYYRFSLSFRDVEDLVAERGVLDTAAEFVERAIAIQTEVLGPGHPELLLSRLPKARVMLARGKARAAREILADLSEALTATFGAEHPRVREAEVLAREAALNS